MLRGLSIKISIARTPHRHFLLRLRPLEYAYSFCSVMFSPCLVFLFLFSVNMSRKTIELFKTAHHSSILPQSYRQENCCRNVNQFTCIAKFSGLSVLLLLCGGISVNPGPISFRAVNCGDQFFSSSTCVQFIFYVW